MAIPVEINDVIVRKLRQDVPEQMEMFCRRLTDARANILVQCGSHANQLIIVPDKYEKAKRLLNTG